MPTIVMTLDAFSSMAIANAPSMQKSTPFGSRVALISPNASLTSHISLASHVDLYSMTMASSIFATSTTTRAGGAPRAPRTPSRTQQARPLRGRGALVGSAGAHKQHV